jgi:colanic acid/amylovoran biosynthesis glycosyltransferase
MREGKADVMHSHFGPQGWFDIPKAAEFGVPQVVSFYGYDVGRLPSTEPRWRDRYQELFESASLFLCEGRHLADRLVDLGCPREKVDVQHLGVKVDEIPFRPRSWHAGEPLRVLIAGTFVEKKGIPYGIEALGRIKDRVDLYITIVGDSLDQDRSKREKARILDTLARQGLESRTRLLGYQPYRVFLEEATHNHVFLSPSVTACDGDTEGGAPVSVIEMAAAGMPVVSSNHCDIPGVLEDGKTGLLAPERDVDALESRLIWLLENPTRWAEMVVAAREHIEREFHAGLQGERLARIYCSISGKS